MTALVGQRCVRERTTVLCAATVCANANGGVSRATVSPSPDTPPSFRPLPSFPKYPQHPNFVIPRAVAESISPCQRISQKSQRPLHSTMDTATSRSMTALVGQRCPRLPTRSSRLSTQSSRLSTPPPIIPGVPAEPQHRHSARSRGIHLCLPTHQPEKPEPFALHYGYCDFAQYDGVGRATVSPSPDTILPSPDTNLPSFDTPSHHSGSTRRTPTPSFRAQSRNPSPPPMASTRKSSALCTPLWILRLRAV